MPLARLQALATCAWLATLVAWVLFHRDSPGAALGGALAIALAHAAVLAVEFLALCWVSRGDAVPVATAAQLWRAWWSETWVAPQVFCWHQPFRSQRFPDQLAPRHQGQRGVVLVHGYLCNRGAWNPWLERLQREGLPFIALDLAPIFAPIHAHVPALEAAISRMTQATGLPPLLVGHSMGGLVMRAWLRQARAPERAHRLVTLGTPHQGTWTAQFGYSPNARQMQPGHPWLQALNADWPPVWRRHFVCFYSNADNMVFPPSHARLAGADNRLLPGLAHVQMAWRPEVITAVLACLDAPALPPAPPEPAC